MAGRRKTSDSRVTVGAPIPSNSLVASAMTYSGAGANTLSVYRAMEGWQREAWRQFEICGELSFAANWIGNAMSRCLIVPGTIGSDGNVTRGDDAQVTTALNAMFGGTQGQSDMLHAAGLHLTVAGEFYLVGRMVNSVLVWEVIGCDSIAVSGTTWSISYGENNTNAVFLTAQDVVIRIWRPDPVRRYAAWSPVKALLPVLRELEMLTRHIFAQATSRLTGSGILPLPASLEFPNSEGLKNKAAGFSAELTKAMMTPLANPDSPSAVVPFVITVPDEAMQYMREAIHFWSPFDEAAASARKEAIVRFCVGMDIPIEVIVGMTRGGGSSGGLGTGASHWCVDDTTEALTRSGWKRQDQLGVGDEVLTLNHVTGQSEWQPVLDVYRAEVQNEPMLLMKNQGHSSLTTPNHRWPTLRQRQADGVKYLDRQITHTDHLDREDALISAAPHAELPTEAKFADDFVEIAAWFWTEGWMSKSGKRRAAITQSHMVNPERCDRIRGALSRLGFKWSESIHSGLGQDVTTFRLPVALYEELEAIGGKRITLDFIQSLTRAQLELFIDVSCQGDGQHYRSGRLDIWQKGTDGLAAFEHALILSGRMLTWTANDGGERVTAHRGATVRPLKTLEGQRSPERVDYTGVLWCPVTSNTTWLARREGTVYFTGNTAWQIEESAIKMHIEPLLSLFCNALTMEYVRPVLKSQTAAATYDVTALKLQPDRSKEAKELFDEGELASKSLLLYSGMKAEDAPDDQERQRFLLKKIAAGSASPDQIAWALQKLGLDGAPTGGTPAAPADNGQLPSTEGYPTRPGPPSQSAVDNRVLLAVSEPLVLRALERVGNRMRNDGLRPPCLAHETHCHAVVNGSAQKYLEGCWSLVAQVADGIADPIELTRVLNAYVENLLTEQAPHTRERLQRYLTLVSA